MKKLSSKEIIAIWFAVVAAVISITALWIPPQGVIDETVLILIGQFLLFIGTLIGINGKRVRQPREAGEAAAGSGSASDGKDNGLNRFADAMRTRCIFLEAASDHERQEYRPNGIRAISRTEGAPCNENPRDGIRILC